MGLIHWPQVDVAEFSTISEKKTSKLNHSLVHPSNIFIEISHIKSWKAV